MNHPAPIHSVLLRSVPRTPQVQLEDRLPAHLGLKQLEKVLGGMFVAVV